MGADNTFGETNFNANKVSTMEQTPKKKAAWEIQYDNEDRGQWYTVGPAKIEFGWNDPISEARAIKDAQLIARAPEMDAEIKELVEALRKTNEFLMGMPHHQGRVELLMVVKKLLSKYDLS